MRLTTRLRRSIAVAALALLAEGAVARLQDSSEAEAVVRTLHDQDERLARVGHRLAVRGLPLCPRRGWATGMTVQLAGQLSRPYRAAAARLLGLADRPTIVIVVAGSAADRGGLRPGDRIAAIDGMPFAPEPPAGAEGAFEPSARVLDTIDAAFADGRASFEILRAHGTVPVDVVADPGCQARFDVRAGGATNASADGNTVQVTSELAAAAASDPALAAVVAHELAHNILGHPQQLERVAGGLLPGFGKSGRLMRRTEIAADRLSMYLLALADYPLDEAIAFWSGFAREKDYGIFSDRTHPGWRERVAAMREEAAQIEELRARGQPIRPTAAATEDGS